MSNAPKFKTFRDLRTLPTGSVRDVQSNTSRDVSTGITEAANAGTHAEVSPVRDFHKVPNSVSRSLDMFRGKSKQVWDYLWSVTRGAIQPVRSIRKSRKEIKDGSGIGSIVTVDAAIEHLSRAGLLKVLRFVGSPSGNEYEVLTPEEIDATYTTYTSTTSCTRPIQKVDVLDVPLSGISSIGYLVENRHASEIPKTSFKDFKYNDDEAFADFARVLKKSSEKISGKISSKNQKKNWKQLAELLTMELEIAAARTESISNVPAFLTEHLRRRLASNSDNQTWKENSSAKTVSKSLQVGKALTDELEFQQFIPEPLTEEGREAVLKTMRGYVDRGEREFMMSMAEVYTAEDWNWLIENLSFEEPNEEPKQPKEKQKE
jgi:hypothetical protein